MYMGWNDRWTTIHPSSSAYLLLNASQIIFSSQKQKEKGERETGREKDKRVGRMKIWKTLKMSFMFLQKSIEIIKELWLWIKGK